MEFKITLQLFADVLETEGYSIEFISHRTACPIHAVSFFNTVNEVFVPGTLYLSLTNEHLPLPYLTDEVSFVTLQHYDPAEIPTNISILMIEDAVSQLRIYNKILSTFDFYRRWKLDLDIAILKRDYPLIARLGMDALHNPLFVHDIKYNYVLWTKRLEGQTVPTVNFRTGVVIYPIDQLDSLINTPAYAATIGTHGAHIYSNYDIDRYRVLYVNLWNQDNEYLGRLCIDEMAMPIMPSHYHIAEYYASKMEELMSYQATSIPTVHERFKDFLRQVQHKLVFETSEHSRMLNDVLWNKNDQYQMYCFAFIKNYQQFPSKDNVGYELENAINESCSFTDNNYVWLIVNLTRNTSSEEDLRHVIQQHLKHLDLHIGISNTFTNFWDMSYTSAQAEYAIKVVSDRAFENLLFCPFSKMAASVIITYGKNCLPLPFLVSPAIYKLDTYDKENQTNYLQTLKVFLTCERNVAEASSLLFIHRTTMMYRISRLEKIGMIDLNNYSERLYLQISFQLIEEFPEIFYSHC